MIEKINWNISGAFCKNKVILDFFLENNLFSTFNSISVYDGVSRCKWNGGRMHYDNPPIKEIQEQYYKLGWGINLTFSNFEIDLDDSLGNSLLEEFHRDGNGIILVNEELRKYIRKNFPKYKIIHSVTGCGHVQELPLRDQDVDFYKSLQDRYDLIIPRCGSSFDPKLKQLDLSRVEIMVNDTCILNCPLYHDHFRKISKANEMGGEWNSCQTCLPQCPLGPECFDYWYSKERLCELVDMGLVRFKIARHEEYPIERLVEQWEGYFVDYNKPEDYPNRWVDFREKGKSLDLNTKRNIIHDT